MTRTDVDCLIIGGGFYGCCLALYLRSVCDRVTLVEAGDTLMTRASRVNQARVHTGFHYPRSALTAAKSMLLHHRFMRDFPDAVADDFQMLYAIARHRSKVSAKRFLRTYADLGAPIARATQSQAALFDPATIEAAFACTEVAFDFSVLRRHLGNRLDATDIDMRLQTEVQGLVPDADGVTAQLSDGTELRARHVFNVTYAQINHLLGLAGLPPAALKHELTEIALVEPPAELQGYGITVMDGPFFSAMPYPSEKLYSLTHVRYTPHGSWTDDSSPADPYRVCRTATPDTRVRHMIQDSRRYVPSIGDAHWVRSLFDVKTVLTKNERDDGRPILFQRKPHDSRVVSILGGKIDNVYDLFDLVRTTTPEFAAADERLIHGTGT
jgi:glycine/D-amino acid oxidase-like deaminating enzyme